MSPLHMIDGSENPPAYHSLNGRFWFGVYPALVSDVKDPDSQGRVKVRLPCLPELEPVWARLATLMGGSNRGSWFIPDEEDEVLVVFEAGDPRRPYVIGGLWNGNDDPPESMDGAGRNNKKLLCSRNRIRILLDDEDGQEKLQLETPGGQKLTLRDGPGSVELIDSNGNSVKLESSGITVNSPGTISIQAGQVNLSCGMLTIDGGMARFSGVVQCDTLKANSVVASSYTPGAGNIV